MEFKMIEIKNKSDLKKMQKIFENLSTICEFYSKDEFYEKPLYICDLSNNISELELYLKLLYGIKNGYEPTLGISDGVYEYLKNQNKSCTTKEVVLGLELHGFKGRSKSVKFQDTVSTALLRHPKVEKVGKSLWKAITKN